MESALFTAVGVPGRRHGTVLRPRRIDSGLPLPENFWLPSAGSGGLPPFYGCNRDRDETVECNAANANPGNNFRGASAKGEPGVPLIEENDHDTVVL
jgi:hypothetical protein